MSPNEISPKGLMIKNILSPATNDSRKISVKRCMRYDMCVEHGSFAIPKTNTLKRISVRYSGDAYSLQCGMQLLIWGEI